jgi:hypothetical protein
LKETITTTMLGVCDHSMKFIYELS